MKANSTARNALVICVGNQLMMDEGIGTFTFECLEASYALPPQVRVVDVGCMSLDMLPLVNDYDLIITVDAVDGTGEAPGTVFRFSPEDMARHSGPEASLHDLKLVDLFDMAALLGYASEGVCFGMQVENMEPSQYHIGLTAACAAKIPLLAESVIAELDRHGIRVEKRS